MAGGAAAPTIPVALPRPVSPPGALPPPRPVSPAPMDERSYYIREITRLSPGSTTTEDLEVMNTRLLQFLLAAIVNKLDNPDMEENAAVDTRAVLGRHPEIEQRLPVVIRPAAQFKARTGTVARPVSPPLPAPTVAPLEERSYYIREILRLNPQEDRARLDVYATRSLRDNLLYLVQRLDDPDLPETAAFTPQVVLDHHPEIVQRLPVVIRPISYLKVLASPRRPAPPLAPDEEKSYYIRELLRLNPRLGTANDLVIYSPQLLRDYLLAMLRRLHEAGLGKGETLTNQDILRLHPEIDRRLPVVINPREFYPPVTLPQPDRTPASMRIFTLMERAAQQGKVLDVTYLKDDMTGARTIDAPKSARSSRIRVPGLPLVALPTSAGVAIALTAMGPNYAPYLQAWRDLQVGTAPALPH